MKCYLLLVFLLVTQPRLLAATDMAKQEGQDLIEQAETKTDIFELPSFEMKANLRIDNNGKPLDGTYLLLWNGSERWREEINFPAYSEVRVGAKGVVFLKRNMDFIPLQIARLHSTLGHGFGLTGSFLGLAPRPNETVKKVKDQKVNGVKVECVEITDHENHSREVCVDASTVTIVRQKPFFDKEMMPIGTKLFPHFLSYVESGKSLVDIHVTDPREVSRSIFRGRVVGNGAMMSVIA
jgi:hypothetical protein